MTTIAINALSIKTYGAPMLSIDPTAALWLAEKVAESGVDGWSAWTRISRARNKIGKGTMFPTYGSVCLPAR